MRISLLSILLASVLSMVGVRLIAAGETDVQSQYPGKTPATLGVMEEYQQKQDYEKTVRSGLQEWDKRVTQLKSGLKSTKFFSRRHRELKRAARHLESDVKSLRDDLAHLGMAQEKKWDHIRDHIDAELSDMKSTYDKVMAE